MPIDRPPSTLRRLGAAAAMGLTVATALLAATGVAAAAPPPPSSSQVSNSDLAPACPAPSPTGFCTELVGAGAATVVDDQRPGGGRGYLRLTTRGPADRATVFAQRFAGMRLADIGDLAYDTFVERTAFGNDQAAPAISIPIRSSRVRTPGGFTTLVWEPRNSGVRVAPFQWQRWTPSTSGGWSVNGVGVLNRFGLGRYTATFAQVKAALPDAVVTAVGLGQGSAAGRAGGTAGLVGGVDRLRVNGTTYDFENVGPSADLGVSVWAPQAAPGATVTARITVTNAGRSPARDVSTALAVSGGGRVSTRDGVVFGQLAAFRAAILRVGESATYTVQLTVDRVPRGPLTLLASTRSALPDPRPANNTARTTVLAPPPGGFPDPGPQPGPFPGPRPGPQPAPFPGPHPGPQAAGQPAPPSGPPRGPAPAPAPGGTPAAAANPAPVPGPAANPAPAAGRSPAPAGAQPPAGPAPAPGAGPARAGCARPANPAPGAAPAPPAPAPGANPAPAGCVGAANPAPAPSGAAAVGAPAPAAVPAAVP